MRFRYYTGGAMKLLNTLLNNGLTVRDGIILLRLSQHRTSSATPLTCELITPANLSRIVTKLVDKGLVDRLSRSSSGEKDQRKVIIMITKKGKEILRG